MRAVRDARRTSGGAGLVAWLVLAIVGTTWTALVAVAEARSAGPEESWATSLRFLYPLIGTILIPPVVGIVVAVLLSARKIKHEERVTPVLAEIIRQPTTNVLWDRYIPRLEVLEEAARREVGEADVQRIVRKDPIGTNVRAPDSVVDAIVDEILSTHLRLHTIKPSGWGAPKKYACTRLGRAVLDEAIKLGWRDDDYA